jgi:twitching motility protein PilT
MALVDSLLTAIARADGDAMVLHVGERPYVVAIAGQVELSAQVLTLEVMSGMLAQLLPPDALRDLAEFGAVEHQLNSQLALAHEQFTVVAARGGDDVWIEIRRQRAAPTEHATVSTPSPEVEPAAPVEAKTEVPEHRHPEPEESSDVPTAIDYLVDSPEDDERQEAEPVEPPRESPPPASEIPELAPEPERPAPVVVPMTRTLRIEVPTRGSDVRRTGLERLLALAVDRNATALFLTSQAKPTVRVDGDLQALEDEATFSSIEIEATLLDLMPEGVREAVGRGEPTEWTAELPDIGRIRCTTFRDHRGLGALFHMLSARPTSADALGLGREIHALASEGDGLVLIASPRAAGKSTVLAAMVDLINRQRSDYVITLERQIRIVHDNRHSLVSQRELRGSGAEMLTVARSALRENPDVLVIDDLQSVEMCQIALDAAGTGLLVLASVAAGSASAAIARVLELSPPPQRVELQEGLAQHLRGVIAQVLLRRIGGGRIAARELLLTTSSVASMLRQGQLTQLALAIDSGRKHGMMSLNDSLVSFVRSGSVDIREAYRKADDRETLLAMLKRDSIDTTFVERLA